MVNDAVNAAIRLHDDAKRAIASDAPLQTRRLVWERLYVLAYDNARCGKQRVGNAGERPRSSWRLVAGPYEERNSAYQDQKPVQSHSTLALRFGSAQRLK